MRMVFVRLLLLLFLLPFIAAGLGGAGKAVTTLVAEADGRLVKPATASTTPFMVEAVACQLRASLLEGDRSACSSWDSIHDVPPAPPAKGGATGSPKG